ncbi:MAG: phage major capsid protein, P2 family [Alphaproteobacteria bacterium HGW-Alphaproteobacteria-13]|nr:MAG: phage major capsid protein, P2 family [Alphaproteobacteria bacterium HGW-Alphaproteobacteria-13]
MLNATRVLFTAYVSQIALLNGIQDATTQFTVDPVIEQKLEEVIKAGSEFLQRINIVPVIQQSGDKVGVGVTRSIAGRTDTSGGTRRNPTDPTDTSDKGRYTCRQTNFDYALRYAKLDMWRHKPDFQTLIRNAIAKQQGRDRIMIGWHGESVAATTDRVANPNLEDVNEGWLHKIRTHAAAHVLDDGDLSGAGEAIYVAPGTVGLEVDYQNLDALVLDAKKMIPEWLRGDTDLVVIVGHDLVDEKYFNIVNAAGDKATEVEAADRILRSEKQLGGLPAVRVPFFPANALLITKLSNLSIYYQEGTRRRFLKDEPELDRIANYESVNEDYVVEDYDITAFVENIVIGKAPTPEDPEDPEDPENP